MTAPNYCVLEGDPTNAIAPRRPDVLCEDMGGLQFQDSATFPPRPNEHVSAKDFKQVEMLVQRLCRMMPVLVVEFTASSDAITAKNVVSAVDSLTASNVTVDWVGGETYLAVSWPTGSLPAKTRNPIVSKSTNASSEADAAQTGSLVDITQATIGAGSYVVEIFGE